MKTGYDKFFASAQKTKRAPVSPSAEASLRKHLKVKTRRKKPFPVAPIITGMVLIGAGLLYLAKPDAIDDLISRVQVRGMGEVSAQEAAKEAAKGAASGTAAPAKDAANTKAAAATPDATKGPAVAEDLSYIDKLRTRKEELDLREKELNQLEEELQRQKGEVDSRIHQLEQMRRDIASVLKDRVESDETQVNKLVDLYSSMKPKQAADVIGGLQEDLAVQVLGKMKKKNAAEVMDLLPADKARGLSEKMTGYKR